MHTQSRKSLTTFASAAMLMLSVAITQAATLNVPSQYSRLQKAIDAAHSGDTIIVAAGTYNDYDLYKPTVWIGKDLTIKGAGAGKTILQSNGFERCLYTQDLTSASSISGFTFQYGWQAGGAGMLNENSNLKVDSCEFSYNQAAFGGGIFNDNCSPTINNCTFHNNVAQYTGGGICNQQGSPTVTNCVFDTNPSDTGGGMYNYINSSPQVTNCLFKNHQVSDGGGMANDSSSNPTVTNCVFFNNMAFHDGGGIHNNYASSATVTNCTFVQNSALSNLGSGLGGAICSVTTPGYGPNSATVTDCILWGNTAALSGPGIYGSATVSHSDVQDLTYSTPDAKGNFGADPQFVNAASGNLRLQSGSPCRDRGTNSVLTSPPFLSVTGGVLVDLDTCRRLSGSTVDLGADEFQSLTDVTAQIKVVKIAAYPIGSVLNQTVFITNVGGTNLNGPISLVINNLSGYTLANKTGVTSALKPSGRPYINLTGTLAPGASTFVTLQFTKTSSTATLSWNPQVFDGIGNR